MTYKCLTHGVVLEVTDAQRKYRGPDGSLRGLPQCWLLTAKEPKEGIFGGCIVERVKSNVP